MSHIGKLSRGLKWYNTRVAVDAPEYKSFNNFFLPEGVADDYNKMADIEYYLAFIVDKSEKAINQTLSEVYRMSKSEKLKASPEYRKYVDELKIVKILPKPAEPTAKVYTEEELFKMVKAEQVVILKELGESTIPGTEAERVAKIMEIQ